MKEMSYTIICILHASLLVNNQKELLAEDGIKKGVEMLFTDSTEAEGIEVVIYESELQDDIFENLRFIKYFTEFKQINDFIVANRLSEEIKDGGI